MQFGLGALANYRKPQMQHFQFFVGQVERWKADGCTTSVPQTRSAAYIDAGGDKTVHIAIDRARRHTKVPRQIGGGV